MNVGLCDLCDICVSVCLCVCIFTFECLKPGYVVYDTWADLSGELHKCLTLDCVPVCVAFLLLLGRGSVNVSLLSLLGNSTVSMLPRQRMQATVEELLDTCVCESVYPHRVVRRQLRKDVPVSTKNCCKRRFLFGAYRTNGKYAISSQNFSFIYQFTKYFGPDGASSGDSWRNTQIATEYI
jgi:hypothetical protein